ncbi:hypothetical protein J6590_086668, partial [Homalodisca vitripennis]
CLRKCYSKLPEDARKQIYDNFRSLNSKNEQYNYLQSLMAASEVKQQRRRKPNTESNKPDHQASFIYEVATLLMVNIRYVRRLSVTFMLSLLPAYASSKKTLIYTLDALR